MGKIFKDCEQCGARYLTCRCEVVRKSDLRKLAERLKDRVDGYTPLDSDVVFCISELEELLKRGSDAG